MNRNQPDFDRVARVYRWAEYLLLGPLLQRVRTSLLLALRPPRQALALGDGDGRFLASLLLAHPELHACAVDTSAAMLHLLQRRCAFAGQRLSVRHTSALSLAHAPAGVLPPDLIVTHFFLDCLSDEDNLTLARWLASYAPAEAQWLISDFAYPSQQPWRLLGKLYVRALYIAFRLLTGLPVQRLPAIQAALEKAGFRRLCRQTFLGGLLFSELWQKAGS